MRLREQVRQQAIRPLFGDTCLFRFEFFTLSHVGYHSRSVIRYADYENVIADWISFV